MSDNPIKLNLGCYNKKLPGFINVDIREDVNPDVVDNAFTLEKFDDNSVDLIYCCHMLEHLDYQEVNLALKRWYDVLKSKGILRLSVPDMQAVFSLYWYLDSNLDVLKTMIYGSQKHPFDYHKSGWDYFSITYVLNKAGFRYIHEWDWFKTDPHKYCDDYSQIYYPKKSVEMKGGEVVKVEGKLMSLNVEATK